MSFVTDQVRRVDAHLDEFQPKPPKQKSDSQVSIHQLRGSTSNAQQVRVNQADKHIKLLESLIKTITSASSNSTILSRSALERLLTSASSSSSTKQTLHAELSSDGTEEYDDTVYVQELEWLLASKLAVQVQGTVLTKLLDQITPVMDDIYYWDTVLGSYSWSALYMVQLLPIQLWRQGNEAVREARDNFQTLREKGLAPAASSITQEWQQFYDLVRNSIQQRRLGDVRTRLYSPVTAARVDARSRLRDLKNQKLRYAAAIGSLTSIDLSPYNASINGERKNILKSTDWITHLASRVNEMNETLTQLTRPNMDESAFEEAAFKADRVSKSVATFDSIQSELLRLLQKVVPEYEVKYHEQRRKFGRPSRMTRYWPAATVLLFSSTTLLRFLVNRKADIVVWLQDLGNTTIAFWNNWIINPVKDIIGTIRHDKDSEIALMSRESLQSDRACLERMVVDFVKEHPQTAGSSSLDEAAIEVIRNKVKEGDLTPVLRAYEDDLKKPFARAVTGNLVRELLIQIQKTKVDIEVAMSGIDALLKSQELVFGFVGLTPGILVCVMFGRWLSESFGGRKGRAQGKLQGRMIRILRNIDRILYEAKTQDGEDHDGMLTYQKHGLVLCEVQVLRANSWRVLPGDVNREFLDDLLDLTNIRLNVDTQIRVVERLRWAYWKWLN